MYVKHENLIQIFVTVYYIFYGIHKLLLSTKKHISLWSLYVSENINLLNMCYCYQKN